ncbi:bifunctional aldolase/short-chain dehydrogenase [Thermoflexus sp.]|uniref:bifunctional aldolase/short-chain dehydrogenase n=1 Tax=Thermoflexus sp. TaxID=1969742 RepID=UPI0035E40830
MPRNLWNEAEAAGLSELELLVYRSHLLGADRSVCNIFGGNTSAKLMETDFRGRPVRVLWVKGSGSDLATITLHGFAALRLDDVLPLMERESLSDEEMVDYLSHCYLKPGMPRPSIETLLHAFIPAPHVDHTHPDAIVSLATSENGPEHVRRLYGDRAVWVPYVRPGFTLSKWIAEAVRANPRAECVVMAKHGLVTWGEDARSCYENTIRIIQEAEEYIAEQAVNRRIFGGVRVPPLAEDRRRAVVAELLPILRGAVSQTRRHILRYDDSTEVLDFVCSERAREVALVGSACPDHLVHTKHWPLFIEWDGSNVEDLKARLRQEVERYREAYVRYFEENRGPQDTMMDPAPRIILIPGLGMVATGKDAFTAGVARDLYYRAIAVMRGATALDRFVSLTPAEAFAVEYWPLELYKLTLRPPERELAGRVVVITGGASGIGRATAYRMAQEGAHVVILDINREGADAVAADLIARYGEGRGMAIPCDVTSEEQVVEAFRRVILAYGGVDIVVNNAGIAHAAPITETSITDWDRLYHVLVRGYFLVAREAFRIWKAQGLGGSMVIVASKNALAPGKNVAAYSSAKAAEVHLARCLAEEGGEIGVRVNVVCPDAVIRGSSIWDSRWREERARSYGIPIDQLEEYYRQRTTLKVNVYPEDVAEAILFFASDRSAKTTGGILTVDGGVATAYVR